MQENTDQKKIPYLDTFYAVNRTHCTPLSYTTDISQNYIPLSHPHYIHHTKYIHKVDKTMIYVMIAIEAEESWYVMKMHKLLPKILFVTINLVYLVCFTIWDN